MHACDCDEGSDHAARLVSLRRNSIQKDSEHFAPAIGIDCNCNDHCDGDNAPGLGAYRRPRRTVG